MSEKLLTNEISLTDCYMTTLFIILKYQNLTTAHVMSLTTNVCQWKDGWTEVFGISPQQYVRGNKKHILVTIR
jgi:hypothetical protein